VLNTSQFVNNTLNNNEVICSVDEFLEKNYASLSETSAASREPRASASA
jgi:hypothetical protein